AIAYAAAAAIDMAERAATAPERHDAETRASLLTPVVKAFASDVGCEVASLGVQVHGGMGFIEETGAAQLLRDIRIAPIYEGTNAIQAIDLVTRKIGRDGGAPLAALIEQCRADLVSAADIIGPSIGPITAALAAWQQATAHLLSASTAEWDKLFVASSYLRLFGIAFGGALLARGAAAAGPREAHWPIQARVFAEDVCTEAPALLPQIVSPHRRISDYRELAGAS
ncbi:MAG: acyl-CoA dehydrogenase family protein, partial [Bradyrhizobium sp.]